MIKLSMTYQVESFRSKMDLKNKERKDFIKSYTKLIILQRISNQDPDSLNQKFIEKNQEVEKKMNTREQKRHFKAYLQTKSGFENHYP